MLISLLILCFVYLLPYVAAAQQKTLPALKINQSIKIDGNLDDAAWKIAEPISNFITISPVFGKPAKRISKVKLVYDNNAIYIGAYLYDNPSTIRKQLTARDMLDRQNVYI